MSAQIFQFKLKTSPDRKQAIRWLATNAIIFPGDFELEDNVGPDMFFGWRFIRHTDGVVYFSNCIQRGITVNDVEQFIALSA